MRVFIADDSEMVCERLTKMLQRLDGVEVVGKAHSVPDAIESISQLKPEVVVLDIQMPGGSGYHVLQNVKKDDPAPIVIMLTNYALPMYRQRSLAAGADYFFDKSIEFDKVVNAIHHLHQSAALV